VLGPTASGKSQLAEALADELEADLLSVDSMQIYRGMDIGTAKPLGGVRVRYHLIDLAEPSEEYSVAEFQEAGRDVLAALSAANRRAVVVGGSGLHFRALVDPLTFPPTDPGLRRRLETVEPVDLVAQLLAVDPEAGAVVDLGNPRRVLRAVEIHALTGATPSQRADLPSAEAVRDYVPKHEFVGVGVDPGDGLRARVERRFDAMLAGGLLEEVAGLAIRLGPTARGAVGYKELLPVAVGEEELGIARDRAIAATMALAKRQRTFFRRDPRIRWLVWHDDPEARLSAARSTLKEAPAWTS
jgi:tRNA dimethylallyltransferase